MLKDKYGIECPDKCDDARREYLKVVRKIHPDKGGDEAEFKAFNQAYEAVVTNRCMPDTIARYANQATVQAAAAQAAEQRKQEAKAAAAKRANAQERERAERMELERKAKEQAERVQEAEKAWRAKEKEREAAADQKINQEASTANKGYFGKIHDWLAEWLIYFGDIFTPLVRIPSWQPRSGPSGHGPPGHGPSGHGPSAVPVNPVPPVSPVSPPPSACVFNSVCELSTCMTKLQGIGSNSASPTDVWILTFPGDRATELQVPGKPVVQFKKAFVKLFINPDDWLAAVVAENGNRFRSKFTDLKLALQGLKYEIAVYSVVTNSLLSNNVSPHFVRSLAKTTECTYDNLLAIVQKDNKKHAAERLSRNLDFMFQWEPKRPSITSNAAYAPPVVQHNYAGMRYCLLVNEAIPAGTKTLYDVFSGLVEADDIRSIFIILFQVVQACYSLYLARTAHNDLHTGNIWIETLKQPITVRYKINGIDYDITDIKHWVKIYDFDTAYSEQLGANVYNTDDRCWDFGLCNKIVEGKDFVKVLCYLFSAADGSPDLQKMMVSCFTSDRKLWYENYRGDQRCFNFFATHFDKVFDYPTIIDKVYEEIDSPAVSEFDHVYVCNQAAFSNVGVFLVPGEEKLRDLEAILLGGNTELQKHYTTFTRLLQRLNQLGIAASKLVLGSSEVVSRIIKIKSAINTEAIQMEYVDQLFRNGLVKFKMYKSQVVQAIEVLKQNMYLDAADQAVAELHGTIKKQFDKLTGEANQLGKLKVAELTLELNLIQNTNRDLAAEHGRILTQLSQLGLSDKRILNAVLGSVDQIGKLFGEYKTEADSRGKSIELSIQQVYSDATALRDKVVADFEKAEIEMNSIKATKYTDNINMIKTISLGEVSKLDDSIGKSRMDLDGILKELDVLFDEADELMTIKETAMISEDSKIQQLEAAQGKLDEDYEFAMAAQSEAEMRAMSNQERERLRQADTNRLEAERNARNTEAAGAVTGNGSNQGLNEWLLRNQVVNQEEVADRMEIDATGTPKILEDIRERDKIFGAMRVLENRARNAIEYAIREEIGLQARAKECYKSQKWAVCQEISEKAANFRDAIRNLTSIVNAYRNMQATRDTELLSTLRRRFQEAANAQHNILSG
jgi:hypothetical protein